MIKLYFKVLFTGFLGIIVSCSVNAQLLINEICPTNISINQNSNGDYDDWVELYNTSGASLNIAGYGLTDDPTKPFDFQFPSYTLNAGQRVLVFTSGKSNEIIAHHWEMAVDANTSWKYLPGSAAIDTNWRNLSFTPTGWSSGNAGIGFGDGDDNTTIPVGVSVMMRKTFTIPDTSQILKAVLMMDYDDAFVAYLNGVEIARSNIGTEGFRPQWNELANSSHEANRYQSLPLDSFYIKRSLFKSIIVPGTNVLTIETHNAPANSDDMSSIPYLFFGMRTSGSTFSSIPSWFHVPTTEYFNADFKMARTGETIYLFNPAGVQVDSKTFLPMEANNSIGRKPDGSGSWCLFATPTPSTSNNSSTCYTAYASVPFFSKVGGYYTGTQSLILSTSTPGGVVRYTTNGNTPTASSPAYSSPISISSTKTIRAKVFASGYLPSPMVTNTFIINGSTHLSTFSITTDSLNLWDYNTGIYVLGPNAASASPYKGANFWQDWEKPATIEYYDKNKNIVVRFDADIKIYGNYSRAKAQKSFEIKLSDKYGMGSFNYQMYPDKSYVDDINNIILRNSGTDWNKVHFRDAFMERLMKNTYTGYLAAEPAIAYLNGAYWGVYCINENHDHHWMKSNFGLDKDQIDYLKESGSTMKIQEGSDATFWTLWNYATNQTPTTQAYYDFVDKYLDLQNYTDYFIAETFYNNGDWIGDWTNNIQLWRPNKPGSKWRYFLYDTDFGMGLQGSVTENRLAIARNPSAYSNSSEMFDAILKNPTYKRYFINRYCDLINTIYLPANMDAIMHSFKDTMAFDMPAHFAKWGSSVSSWNSNISSMMTFANARPAKMQDFIKTEFSLTGKVTLTLQASPAGAGRIEISTITPGPLPWSGVYFNGNPVTITAIPNPGYTFDHWHSNTTITTNNFNKSVTYNFASNDVITAFFTGSAVVPKICISELNYNSKATNDAGDWIELHNYGTVALDLSGWKLSDGNDNHVYKIPTGTTIAPNGYLVLVEDTAKFAFQFPSVNKLGLIGFNFSNAGDQIRLFDHTGALFESFFYQDLTPWPVLADGAGYTCELSANTANPNDGNSWFAGCIGGSPGQAYSPILSIPVAISGTTTFCSGGSATLNATSVAGYVYQWRRNGIIIPGATDTIYNATQSGNYTVSVTYQGCSTTSTATAISVVTQQPDPVCVSATRCGPGDLTLIASASDSVFWFDAPSGGNQVGAGDTLFIPYISQTTTYYAITGRNCSSNPVATNANITPEAASPVALDLTRCGPGSVTLTATDTAVIRWYNQAVGGGLLETGTTFVTNILNNDTSFFVEAGSVCPSPRVQVNVTVNTSPEPIVTDASRCGNGTLTLNAASSFTVAWYTTANGGSPVYTGNPFTTASLALTDTFYAEANGGCPSVRVPGIAIVNPIPSNPVAPDVSICNPGSVALSATAPEIIRWYDAPSGGNLLFTGAVYNTPVLSTTTTYYVENGYTCPSQRLAVQAIISAAPAAPSTADVPRCGPGSVTLSASSPETIYWYSAPTGGTLLFTGSSYNTPSLSGTTTYYVEAGDFCRSIRVPVQAVINSIPAPPTAPNVSNCGPGSLVLTATSNQSVYWYSAASGGTLLQTGPSYTTPLISSSTTYYVETGDICLSNRIAVQAIISSPPSTPVAPDVSRCGNGTVTLGATSNGPVSWFTTPSGGTAIATGNSYTTPSLSSTATYYVEANNGCISARVPVEAIINPVPNPPTTSNVTNCGSGAVTLTATSTEQIYWYTVASGGSSVATGGSYTTPIITTTTTYYVEAGNNCRSTRIPVQAIIVQSLSAPTLTSGTRCGQGTVTLTASSSSTVNWFTSPSGGSPVGSGLSFTTPVISSTTTYYAEATNSGCYSPRASVQAVINNPPNAPVTTDNSRCGPGTVSVSATSGSTIHWYSVPTGGISLGTGTSFTTPSISVTTTYYAEATNGCTSSRSSVQAIINPVPAAPGASNANRCGTGTVVLNATSTEQIYWYTVASGGSPVATGTSYTTPSISATTTYYVETGDNCRSTRIPVQAIITQVPASPTLTSASTCGPGSVTIVASSAATVSWFTSASGGSPIATGISFNTPVILSTTTYYAEASSSGCTSTRSSVQAVVNAIPAAPVTTDGSHCGTGSVSLSATSSGNVNWYTVPTGGFSLGSGLTFNTPSVSATTTYYAETFDGCSSTRTPTQAVINPVPAAPTVSGASHCGAGTVTLSAVSPETINWFTAATGGTSISTGTYFITPTLSVTTTYYAEAGTTCLSIRVPVQAVINNIPPSPVLTDGSHCGPGTVLLHASSSATVSWFAAASGGTSIGTGLNFTTPSILSTTTFYAEAGPAGCNSPRVPVQAIINPVPVSPVGVSGSRCGPGSVTLTATGSGQLYWYSTSTSSTVLDSGATFLTPSISATRNYYVETTNGLCRSTRVPVQALINQLPNPPVTTNVSRCSAGTITLNATAPQAIYWYDASTGGTLLTTGTSYTTPVLTTTTTYYIETGTTCHSIRIPVQAQIVSPPNPPALFDTTICSPGVAVIRAQSNVLVSWFSAPSGGTAIDTGLYFTTPVISGPTTFYAEAGFGCNSIRVPVNVTIHSVVNPPVAADSTRCGIGSLLLAASAPDSIYWYDSPAGGTLLGTGSVFNTPVIYSSATYYVETGSLCRSVRIPVRAILTGTQITASSQQSICGSGSAVLSVIATVPSDSIFWYDQPGGTNVGTGNYYITPTLNSTTTYYVETHSTCTGPPVAVDVTVYPLPVVNLGADTIIVSSGQSVILDAGAGFDYYLWSTNDTTQLLEVFTEGVYLVSVTDSNSCIGTDQVFVDFINGFTTVNGKNILSVYPNPANDKLTVLLPDMNEKSVSMKFFAVDGKLLKNEEVKSSNGHFTKTLSLSGVASGVYFLVVENNSYRATVRVVVE